jgi:hypothetical protein
MKISRSQKYGERRKVSKRQIKMNSGILAYGAKLKVDGSMSFKTRWDEEVGEKLIKLHA